MEKKLFRKSNHSKKTEKMGAMEYSLPEKLAFSKK